jgi:hypothetical protein
MSSVNSIHRINVVLLEACGDRNQSAHYASLHEMYAKYAEVVPAKDLCGQSLKL